MKTLFKHNPPIPYSLHDMKVNRISFTKETLKLEFEDGYEKIVEPFKQVEGSIRIEGVDLEYGVDVVLKSKWGKYGKFQGEKLRLSDFLTKYKWNKFEIVDELYGYNQLLYSGYLSTEDDELIEMDISIYFTGNIVYETVE